uniref:AP-5 complex subunit zeta-1 N-terminal TPR domain-containing protein n=1 Tax=Oryzias sinensis TaxID=183150 RepID=A0A8C7XNJ6_9TELE
MYSHGSESLIRQAREIQDSELQKFYIRLVKLLQFKEVSHELLDSLHRLYLILSANKYSRTKCVRAYSPWKGLFLTFLCHDVRTQFFGGSGGAEAEMPQWIKNTSLGFLFFCEEFTLKYMLKPQKSEFCMK